MAGVIVGGSVVGAGVAASAPSSADATPVHACAKRNHHLRVVDAPSDCKKSERAITLNQGVVLSSLSEPTLRRRFLAAEAVARVTAT